jgi:hypothetical protein
MIEKTTRILSENLARTINRRKFLRRFGEATFLGMAAMAAGHNMASTVSAGVAPTRTNQPPGPPQCAPPGPYCNLNGVNEPNGCMGGACYQHNNNGTLLQCRVYYTYYQAGCWTTAVSGGYWVCCDCECGTPRQRTCGCAQFSTSPYPRPDVPAPVNS